MNYLQYKNIGITGNIGFGKTFFAQQIKNSNPQFSIYEIDDIRRLLLWQSKDVLAIELRNKMIEKFSLDMTEKAFIHFREQFTQIIFKNQKNLHLFNQIATPYFKQYLLQKLQLSKHSLIVWSRLVEDDYLDLINYVIILNPHQKTWKIRNSHQLDMISSRLQLQDSIEYKIQLLNQTSIPYEVICE